MDTSTTVAARAPARAGRREWFGVVVISLPTLLMSVDLSVLFLALPNLSADLAPSGAQQLWIVDIYGLMLASFLIPMGSLGDRIGRRALLLAGAAAFGIASVWAAFAGGPGSLIAARAAMGLAGATLAPSSLALINSMFTDPRQRGAAVAVWMSCFMGGSVLGPIVGGVMLASWWWGSVFLLAVPVTVLLLATGPVLLPESRDPEAGRPDPVSVALAPAALLLVMYGITEGARDGWGPPPVIVAVIGVTIGVLFVLRQSRIDHPVLDLSLFRNRTYRPALVLGVAGGAIQGGGLLMANIHLQSVAGLSPLAAGMWMIPATLTMILGIMVGSGLSRKLRPAHITAGGLVLSTAGYLLVTQVGAGAGVPLLMVFGFAIAMAGIGPGISLGYGMVLQAVPPAKAGAASATVEAGGQFGVATGIAVLGSIGAAAYRDQLSVPGEIPAHIAAAAREGVTGAVAIAPGLPDRVGAELLASAHDAFTAGLHSVAVAGAAMFAVLAGYVLVALRHVPPVEGAPAAAPPQAAERSPHAALTDERKRE